MNKKLEKSLFYHIMLLLMVFVVFYKFYNINIVDSLYTITSNMQDMTEKRIENDINNIKNDPNYELDEYKLADEKYNTLIKIENVFHTIYYIMPALIIFAIMILMYLEKQIMQRLKIARQYITYDKNEDKEGIKLRRIIREKLRRKFQRISLTRKVPILLMIIVFVNTIISIENAILIRTIDNLIILGYLVLFVYGLRLVINIFRDESRFVRGIICFMNLAIAATIPQIYFIIGFVESLFSIRIIIKKQL